MDNPCIRFGVSLPEDLLKRFDENISNRGYSNRSEAIRDLIRDNLVKNEWENISGDTAATVILVYDHHQRGLTSQLTEKQHEHHKYIIATMHAHLDKDNCIEVILLRGKTHKIRKVAESLSSQKHVKLGRFIPATLGKDI